MKKKKVTLRHAQGDTEQWRSITKDMTIGEVVQKYPKTTFVFIDYGLHCIGCEAAADETVEQAAQVHRLDLDKFLKDLNKVADNK